MTPLEFAPETVRIYLLHEHWYVKAVPTFCLNRNFIHLCLTEVKLARLHIMLKERCRTGKLVSSLYLFKFLLIKYSSANPDLKMAILFRVYIIKLFPVVVLQIYSADILVFGTWISHHSPTQAAPGIVIIVATSSFKVCVAFSPASYPILNRPDVLKHHSRFRHEHRSLSYWVNSFVSIKVVHKDATCQLTSVTRETAHNPALRTNLSSESNWLVRIALWKMFRILVLRFQNFHFFDCRTSGPLIKISATENQICPILNTSRSI